MSGFAFLLNVGKIEGTLPFELLDGYRLDRATDRQIKEIEGDLKRYDDVLHFPLYRENHWIEQTAALSANVGETPAPLEITVG